MKDEHIPDPINWGDKSVAPRLRHIKAKLIASKIAVNQRMLSKIVYCTEVSATAATKVKYFLLKQLKKVFSRNILICKTIAH